MISYCYSYNSPHYRLQQINCRMQLAPSRSEAVQPMGVSSAKISPQTGDPALQGLRQLAEIWIGLQTDYDWAEAEKRVRP
jgi:hypothetical protein